MTLSSWVGTVFILTGNWSCYKGTCASRLQPKAQMSMRPWCHEIMKYAPIGCFSEVLLMSCAPVWWDVEWSSNIKCRKVIRGKDLDSSPWKHASMWLSTRCHYRPPSIMPDFKHLLFSSFVWCHVNTWDGRRRGGVSNGIESPSEPASSGHSKNCTFWHPRISFVPPPPCTEVSVVGSAARGPEHVTSSVCRVYWNQSTWGPPGTNGALKPNQTGCKEKGETPEPASTRVSNPASGWTRSGLFNNPCTTWIAEKPHLWSPWWVTKECWRVLFRRKKKESESLPSSNGV